MHASVVSCTLQPKTPKPLTLTPKPQKPRTLSPKPQKPRTLSPNSVKFQRFGSFGPRFYEVEQVAESAAREDAAG